MELTVLGCGDAFGSGGRNHTSFLLTEGKEHILLDCGASTLIRLKHEKINLEEISAIIITHFHGDHFGGLPFFFISSMFENPRTQPLTIVGPKGVQKRVHDLQEAMYEGTAVKMNQLDLTYLEYQQGIPTQLDNQKIMAWEVEHSPASVPHGVRLEWGEKKIAFSGDTSWTDALIPMANDTDIFICECNFMGGEPTGHLSYEELLSKEKLLNTKQLWLTHMSNEVIEAEDCNMKRLYDGQKILF